jgi:hypothetical protein
MSGGGSSGSTTSTVTNTTIPKQFYPFFERVLKRGEAISNQDYIPYQGQRLADTSADTSQSYGIIRDMANRGMPGTQAAMGMTQNAYNQAGQIGAGGPYQFSEYGYSDPGTFSGQAIGQYMSPYMQDVVNAQKLSAAEDFQIANQSRAAQAAQAGAFGGSRQAVQQGMAERDLLTRTNQIQSEGLQKSYEDAQRMFEQDRAARMATDQARAAELSRVQAGQAGENLNYANLGLNRLQFQSDLANQTAALERAARAGDVQAAQLLQAQGAAQQGAQQAGLDIGYQDFLRQMGYPMEQLERYASILHGSPVANATTQTTSVPYNPLQQYLGMGISALGLYNAMG